eukprot:Seg250.10 transcript_id=Seg250.10/GoldUCD/mRNA.D3Y31 product="hypothetical protein" protein_id=Seg250.10/GoldUCD/D3Y31
MPQILRCPECNITKFSILKYVHHLAISHPQKQIICGINSCPAKLLNARSFRAHLYLKHRDLMSLRRDGNDTDNEIVDIEVGDEDASTSQDLGSDDNELMPDDVLQPDLSIETLLHGIQTNFALFLLRLSEQHILTRQVQFQIAKDTKFLMQFLTENFAQLIKFHLRKSGFEIEEHDDLRELLDDNEIFTRSIENIQSAHMYQQYCNENLSLIEPISYTLGIDKDGKPETMQYVPLLQVLKLLLSKEDVLSHVLNDNICHSKDYLEDYDDGEIFQGHELFSVDSVALRLHFYTDEFEVANPLGSKRSIHKMCAFYYSLGNIHPRYRSQLKHIYLSILIKHKLLKEKYTYADIMKPLIDELKILQTQGIKVKANHKEFNIFGAIATISSDNLSAHSLAGFNACFSSGRVCRTCMATYNDMKTKFREDDFLMRTEEVHKYQMEMIQENPAYSNAYGVKGRCPLYDLECFKVTQSFPPDAMHDVLEGVVPHLLHEVICGLVNERVVTLGQINFEIENFKYGKNDRKNKPVQLSKSFCHADSTVTGSAAEKWCLFRLLSLMIGSCIQKRSEHWELYLLLRKIVDIIFAPVVERSWLPYLQDLVENFQQEYAKLYPQKYVPKVHFLVHYAQHIRQFGPLRRLWCMRFEAKHKYFKNVAKITHNFRNIAATLASRHQLRQCLEMNLENIIDVSEEAESDCHKIPFQSLDDAVKVHTLQLLKLGDEEIEREECIWKTSKLMSNCSKYEMDDLIIIDLIHTEDVPVFLKVEIIFKFRATWIISGRIFIPEQFCHLSHSFVVNDTKEYLSIQPGMEVDFQTLDMYIDCKGNNHVTLKHMPVKKI